MTRFALRPYNDTKKSSRLDEYLQAQMNDLIYQEKHILSSTLAEV